MLDENAPRTFTEGVAMPRFVVRKNVRIVVEAKNADQALNQAGSHPIGQWPVVDIDVYLTEGTLLVTEFDDISAD